MLANLFDRAPTRNKDWDAVEVQLHSFGIYMKMDKKEVCNTKKILCFYDTAEISIKDEALLAEFNLHLINISPSDPIPANKK